MLEGFVPVDIFQVVPGEVRRKGSRGNGWKHLPYHFSITCIDTSKIAFKTLTESTPVAGFVPRINNPGRRLKFPDTIVNSVTHFMSNTEY